MLVQFVAAHRGCGLTAPFFDVKKMTSLGFCRLLVQLSGWSVASGFFYASVAALFAAVCITAPMTLARSSGWLCIGVFSLLLFPVARKTVVLSKFEWLFH